MRTPSADLDPGLPDNLLSAQVPGDGHHGVFADPVGQAVMILSVGQTRTRGSVDNQAPWSCTNEKIIYDLLRFTLFVTSFCFAELLFK